MSEFKPFLIAWNLTQRCNLRCAHCYLSAGERDAGMVDELTTEECLHVVDELCQVNPATMLVLTGGEPLLRRDLLQIAQYAAKKGLMVVVGTNGTLLTDARVRELQNAGVMGVSISIDSLDPRKHDGFRCSPGALEGAIRGIEACNRNRMPFQVHTTASQINFDEIGAIMEFAYHKKARVFNLFFLVCTGRGEAMSDITPQQYEQILECLVDAEPRFPGMLVRSRCAPHFKRIAFEKDPNNPVTKAQGYEGGGCLAGTHYARITPEGDLTPCPFMPILVGNLRKDRFSSLWEQSPVFEDLRSPQLKGKCGDCEYTVLCGGCRARPYACHGDYLDEDMWCLYTPKGGSRILPLREPVPREEVRPIWTQEAQARLSRLPYFLQKMIQGRVERYAREAGVAVITLGLMEELRKKAFGNTSPQFRDGFLWGKVNQDTGLKSD